MKRLSGRFSLILTLALIAWTSIHLFWIFTANVNWDEFALLARSHDTLRTGALASGGRPGLATLLLIPLVDGCRDAVQAVRWSRGLWTFFAIAILAGLWGVLRCLFEGRSSGARDAALGVALLALTPAFLRYSLQVRTDQPAIAFGLLGGLALLHSRRRPALAVLGGLLAGTGYLFSQKLIYVAALVGLLALGDVLLRRDFRPLRDTIRAALALVGAAAVVGAYRALTPRFFELPSAFRVSGQLNVFEFYRQTIGYRLYFEMTPELLVHIALVVLLLVRTPRVLRAGGADRGIALLAWGVLGLGLAVALFHGGAFPYFWMTLGLFPAVGIAVGAPLLREGLGRSDQRMLYLAVWTALIVTAGYAGASLFRDTQRVQRDTLRLVDANFDSSAEGFHPERALLCREGAGPFPIYFSQSISGLFYGPEGPAAALDFMDEFRSRPVSFIVRSFRLDQFPEIVRDFWADHYVPYSAALLVPGVSLDVSRDSEIRMFDVIVPGDYRLHSMDQGAVVTVDGLPVRSGATVALDTGVHEIAATAGTKALLTLSLPDSPGTPVRRFYQSF